MKRYTAEWEPNASTSSPCICRVILFAWGWGLNELMMEWVPILLLSSCVNEEEQIIMNRSWSMRSMEWAHILLISCLRSKKTSFQRLQAYPSMTSNAMPLLAQGIKCLNQLLEELNDWFQRTTRVAEGLWVLPLTFWLTLWLRGWNNSPPYSLWDHAPIFFVAVHN